MKKDSLVYTVIFSFTITFILVFILSLAAAYTGERVEKNQALSTARAYLLASGIEIEEGANVEELFRKTFNMDTPGSEPIRAVVGDLPVIVSPFSGKGLWGTITGVIAVDNTFSRIVGMEITSHSETPGLGGRIEEDWFKEQFRGESISTDIMVVQSGGMGDTDPDNGILDGITGATRTSESMQNIINNQVKTLKEGSSKESALSDETLLKRAVLEAGGIYSESEAEIEEIFKAVFNDEDISQPYIEGVAGEKKIVAAKFTAEGYSGDIKGVLLLDLDLDEIMGVEIISQSEKQGAAIEDSWFKEQFTGIKTSEEIIIGDTSQKSKSPKRIVLDGISGATATNKAVERGINKVIQTLKKEGVIYE